MKRQMIEDGETTKWFDVDKATKYNEDTCWNGSNRVSVSTGSQWDHHVLYRTAGGSWVRHRWSQYQGRGESWVRLSPSEAVQWLIANNHELPEELVALGAALEI